MIRNVAVFITIVGFVVLQVSILPVHVSPAFKPDLLLIVTVFLALRFDAAGGAIAAWLLGLLKDVFSGLYLGLNAFSFLVIFLIIKNVSDLLYAESGELFVVTVSVATAACVSLNMLLLVMLTSTPGISYSMGAGLVPHLLVNAFAASLATLLPIFTSPQEVA